MSRPSNRKSTPWLQKRLEKALSLDALVNRVPGKSRRTPHLRLLHLQATVEFVCLRPFNARHNMSASEGVPVSS
jgi:hypothetical protein